MTFLAREIRLQAAARRSGYHFSTKDRDRAAAAGGLLRLREFIMKDCTRSTQTRPGSTPRSRGTSRPTRGSSSAAGSRPYLVEAESGVMGGKVSRDFLAPTGSGENELMRCENGRTTSPTPRPRAARRLRPTCLRHWLPRRSSTRRTLTTIEDVANLLGSPSPRAVEGAPGRDRRPARARGSCGATTRLSRGQARDLLRGAFRPAADDEIRAAFGAGGGSLGPVGVDVEVVADEALARATTSPAPNEAAHLRGVEAGPRLRATFADIRQAKDGERLPRVRRHAPRPDGDRGRPHLQAPTPSTRRRSARRFWTRTGRRSCS